MIKKPHLDHTQALSSYVSGSLGTLKKCFYGLKIFSNPWINITTKRSNKSRELKEMETLTKKQLLKRLKEQTLEKINAICKEKITKDFKSNYRTL